MISKSKVTKTLHTSFLPSLFIIIFFAVNTHNIKSTSLSTLKATIPRHLRFSHYATMTPRKPEPTVRHSLLPAPMDLGSVDPPIPGISGDGLAWPAAHVLPATACVGAPAPQRPSTAPPSGRRASVRPPARGAPPGHAPARPRPARPRPQSQEAARTLEPAAHEHAHGRGAAPGGPRRAADPEAPSRRGACVAERRRRPGAPWSFSRRRSGCEAASPTAIGGSRRC